MQTAHCTWQAVCLATLCAGGSHSRTLLRTRQRGAGSATAVRVAPTCWSDALQCGGELNTHERDMRPAHGWNRQTPRLEASSGLRRADDAQAEGVELLAWQRGFARGCKGKAWEGKVRAREMRGGGVVGAMECMARVKGARAESRMQGNASRPREAAVGSRGGLSAGRWGSGGGKVGVAVAGRWESASVSEPLRSCLASLSGHRGSGRRCPWTGYGDLFRCGEWGCAGTSATPGLRRPRKRGYGIGVEHLHSSAALTSAAAENVMRERCESSREAAALVSRKRSRSNRVRGRDELWRALSSSSSSREGIPPTTAA